MDKLNADGLGDAGTLRQSLSALTDGEAGSADVAQACAAWRDDGQARADWHVYALIGDVLRSEDLAHSGEHDRAFLARLQARLADEPVVLAPTAPAAEVVAAPGLVAVGAGHAGASATQAMPRRHWSTSMAVAAGAMAVVGVTAVMRNLPTGAEVAPQVAVVQPAPGIAKPSALVNARTLAALESPVPASDSAGRAAYLHSAEIDRYLNAHRQYAQGSVLATPGGLRQVATSPADR